MRYGSSNGYSRRCKTSNSHHVADSTPNTRDKLSHQGGSRASKSATALIQETNDMPRPFSPPQRAKRIRIQYSATMQCHLANQSQYQLRHHRFIQAQREIIVKLTETSTIESLRAKNPRTLQSHVDRAIEQSKNKNIEHIRVASANQLKSGDLSIKTTRAEEAEALKQFANFWVDRIGYSATV